MADLILDKEKKILDPLRPIKSDREDGRFLHTDLFLRDWFKRYTPKLAYKSGMSKEEFAEWQIKVKEKLLEILRFPKDVPPQPEPKLLWEEQRDGYRVQKWECYPEPYSVVPYLMLIPNGVNSENPAPAVMCYPGTFHPKESLCEELDIYRTHPNRYFEFNQMAKHFVKEGFVAVAVEHPGYGELRPVEQLPDERFCFQMLTVGRNYQGLSAFQKKVIVDWANKLDFVQKDNILLSGHSLGKYPCMFLGIVCDCVKGIIYNDSVYDTIDRYIAAPGFYLYSGCWSHLIPDCEEWFTTVDILCAYAPKLLLASEGGVTKDLNKVKDAYKTAGNEGAFEFVHYPKYQDPQTHKYDDATSPPECVGDEEYFVYANADTKSHYFKKDVAIPWAIKHFKK